MTPGPITPDRLAQLLETWARVLAQHAPPAAATAKKPPLVPHLAAASDRLLDEAGLSLALSAVPVTPDLLRARAAVVCPPNPADPWPAPDPVARIKAPAPVEFLPGEIDPVTLAAVDGMLAGQQEFKSTVLRMLQGDDPAAVLKDDLPRWAAALLGPWAEAGFLAPQDAGRLRTTPSNRSGLSLTPPVPEDVPACLDHALDHPDLTRRPLLVHLALLAIQPWPTGNGRLARLAHAALELAAGRRWPSSAGADRPAYLAAAQAAVTGGDPLPMDRLYRT